ncbi:hypothetical protein ABXT08_07205 [Chryseobacterium sp. NRRL B-14859]|uniref:hypothetical protein n=1 Tax=Chryseobacterium sp. NRRL B-14859 TaxID=1562763 RepID=UPI0033988F68
MKGIIKMILLYSLCLFLSFCGQQKKTNNTYNIDEFQEGKKVNRYEYVNDTISKVISYNSDTGKIESEIKYFNGAPDYKNDLDLEQEFLNYKEFLNILTTHKIKPINPIILGSDLKDLSTVLSIADSYDDFKQETSVKDKVTIIKFVNFNKNIRFSPSLITLFIPDNTIIMDYELLVENGQPLKESYKIRGQILVKEYVYQDGRLKQILYKMLDNQNKKESIVFEKKFEYKN